MGKMLYVGNLPFGTSDNDLQNLFAPHGTIQSAQVIMDRDTDHSRGFAFVEMDSVEEAEAAIAALNGTDFGGRAITVNEALSEILQVFGSDGKRTLTNHLFFTLDLQQLTDKQSAHEWIAERVCPQQLKK